MKNITKLTLPVLLAIISLLLASCSDSKEIIEPDAYIDLSENTLLFDRIGSSQIVTIATSAKTVTSKVSPEGWCTASYSDGKLIVSTISNPNSDTRATIITIEAEGIKKNISVSQHGRNSSISDIKDDIKILVKSGEASSYQSGSEIEKSFDGNINTMYHSKWGNDNHFPITLTYNFEGVTTMDYLVYNTRMNGSNGLFKEFELWIATKSEPQLKKYGEYDFKGSASASRITFTPALGEVTSVKFVVKSGVGDNEVGFASCAEMEFYKKNPDNFDYLTIFTDNTCSELKSTITESEILKIESRFFRELALEIFKKEYDPEFRVQSYNAYQHPDVMAKTNKTSTYGLRDNPTGIYANPGEELIVFVENTHGQNISLKIQDPNKKLDGASYSLATGMNKIKADNTGLMYIMYYTQTGKEPSVKINIASGTVNGYFDNQKHKKDDWTRLINKATFKHFDMKGKYAIMTFETAAFKEYTSDGLGLINKYDELVRLEQEFMGLTTYGKEYKNRAHFLVVYGDNYMYATGNYTGYNNKTQADVLNLEKFSTNAVWGPAHELGHTHQTRPGLRWQGMAEVTNNIHSLYVQTQWGNQSRLIYDGFYNEAFKGFLKSGIPHNAFEGSGGSTPFIKLVPFWQLQLYMSNVLGNKSFYKYIYEKVRVIPNVNTSNITEGYYQLNFVKLACESSGLDLTDFFEAWGFFIPIDIEMDDYGKQRFTITQEQIDRVKAEIAAQKYPKPKHPNIYDIRDDNVSNFK